MKDSVVPTPCPDSSEVRRCLMRNISVLAASLVLLAGACAETTSGNPQALRNTNERDHGSGRDITATTMSTTSWQSSRVDEPEFDHLGVVALLADDDSEFGRLCTGVLVGVGVVLSAAHCVAKRSPQSIIVRALDGQSSTVNHIAIDPSFRATPTGIRGDYALIALNDPIAVRPVALVEDDSDPYVGAAEVLSMRGEPGDLRLVHNSVDRGDDTRCDLLGAPAIYDRFLMLCMFSTEGDFMDGDSGSPVLVSNAHGVWHLAGIFLIHGGSSGQGPRIGIASATSGYAASWLRGQLSH